jgi:hypothetical protein
MEFLENFCGIPRIGAFSLMAVLVDVLTEVTRSMKQGHRYQRKTEIGGSTQGLR